MKQIYEAAFGLSMVFSMMGSIPIWLICKKLNDHSFTSWRTIFLWLGVFALGLVGMWYFGLKMGISWH
jgi:hypothetical protein